MKHVKSKFAAAALILLLGPIGAHRYYLGYHKQGIIQTVGCLCLLVSSSLFSSDRFFYVGSVRGWAVFLLLFFIPIGIWVVQDLVQIFSGELKPANGSKYLEDRPIPTMQEEPTVFGAQQLDNLEKLGNLYKQGILTEIEFENKKKEILGRK